MSTVWWQRELRRSAPREVHEDRQFRSYRSWYCSFSWTKGGVRGRLEPGSPATSAGVQPRDAIKIRDVAPDGLRFVFSPLLVLVFTLIVGSGCRSVSVEFNVLSDAPTPVPTAAAAAPVQQSASSTTLAIEPKPTADATVPAPSTAPSGLSFAPRGVSDSASGTLASQDQRDSFPFQGTQGQLSEPRVRRTSGLTLMPRVELLDPSGAYEVKPHYSSGPEVQVERTLAIHARRSPRRRPTHSDWVLARRPRGAQPCAAEAGWCW
jgi:hypothetical protein